MSKTKVYFDETKFSYEDAISMAQAVFFSEEKNFHEIKNEKWYKRFLAAVRVGGTKGEKRIINDIQSLSALQKLVVKVYGNQFREVNSELNKIINSAKATNETVMNLYYACILKISPQENLKSLNDYERQILLLYLSRYQPSNEKNKESFQIYKRNLARAMHENMPFGDFSSDKLGKVKQVEIFYRCILELCALDGGLDQLDFSDDIWDGLEYLSISVKKKKELEESVARECNEYGVKFFLEKYNISTLDIDISDIELGGTESDEEKKKAEQEKAALLDQEMQEMEKKARAIVAAGAVTTGASGVIPVPIVDMPMMITGQVAMLASICGVYKINIKKDGLKTLVLAAFGVGGAAMIGKTVATSLLKALPFANIVGMTVSAGTAGVITTALGLAFVEVCKAYKRGDLQEDDITGKKGVAMMKKKFKENMDKEKSKTHNQ